MISSHHLFFCRCAVFLDSWQSWGTVNRVRFHHVKILQVGSSRRLATNPSGGCGPTVSGDLSWKNSTKIRGLFHGLSSLSIRTYYILYTYPWDLSTIMNYMSIYQVSLLRFPATSRRFFVFSFNWEQTMPAIPWRQRLVCLVVLHTKMRAFSRGRVTLNFCNTHHGRIRY